MQRSAPFPWQWSKREQRDFYRGLLFISPWLAGLLIFLAFPLLSSIYFSLTEYDILRPPKFIGLANYQRLFEDRFFSKAISNTLFYVIFGVPLFVATAFLLASLLNTNIKFRSVFRTIFYVPAIVPTVAAAMVWLWIFNIQYGLINTFITSLGLPSIPFLSSQEMVKPSLILIGCWASGTSMLIFLAALQDVPRSLIDAAVVDGANGWQRFWHITIPMCTPAILFVMLTGMIGAFQYFAFAWVLTRGGPNRASEFYSVYLYKMGFQDLRMGYAATLGWVLFLIVVLVTVIFYRSSARWVYYGGE
jgi:ABC-type sugar transport system permease subunit